MKLRPMRFDFYLGRAVFTTVLLTWAVLTGLDVVMAFSGEFKDIGKNGYTLGHAAAWVLYTVPRRAYTFFPTAAVIGALMGLGQLAATSELTALRALGLSRKRLSVSVAIALSLLTAVMVLSAETLGPWGQDRADALKSSAKWGQDISTARIELDFFWYATCLLLHCSLWHPLVNNARILIDPQTLLIFQLYKTEINSMKNMGLIFIFPKKCIFQENHH